MSDIEKVGILFYLMKNKVNVKSFKQALMSENFGLATLPESIRKQMNIGD